jgi:ATP phosphoribosyltransferase
MVRVALPNKGRLTEDIAVVLDEAGLPIRGRSERALVASLGDAFEAIFVRAEDIPEFVADGAADAGVTGWDLVRESGRSLTSLLDLEFGRCRLVVAAKDEKGPRRVEDVVSGARVATRFPRVTRAYFAERHVEVEIVTMAGAVEVAPHLGIADIIVDLTSTGSTLRVNGLSEIGTVLESTARLVARAGETPKEEVRDLTTALASVLRARGKRYLMANAPRERLEEVRKCLPGLNAPTISELSTGGRFVAMHAVVAADLVYRTIGALKALGCEGILVTRIERLMP